MTGLAAVEREDDPRRPGRAAYRISGPTAAIVQDAIDTLMSTVDVAFGGVPGHAQFIGPSRTYDGWGALGFVTVHQMEGLPA